MKLSKTYSQVLILDVTIWHSAELLVHLPRPRFKIMGILIPFPVDPQRKKFGVRFVIEAMNQQ
jgi:hypothetical protein